MSHMFRSLMVLCLTAALGACATTSHGVARRLDTDKLSLELERAEFDGRTLRGRVLVGSVAEAQVLGVRSLLIGGVSIDSAAECSSNARLQLLSTSDFGWAGTLPGATDVVVTEHARYARDFAVTPLGEPVSCALLGVVVPVTTATGTQGLAFQVRARRAGSVEVVDGTLRER